MLTARFRRGFMGKSITALAMVCLASTLALPDTFAKGKAPRFKTDKAVRVVVMGGSISMYYKGNYGEYLAHGCKNIEVVNRAKVGAGGRALVKRLRKAVLSDRQLMQQLAQKEAWMLFQGGLNSVFSPEMTNSYLAHMFKLARDSGMRTFALSLTPWGKESDARFKGFEGVRFVRATKKINAFLAGRLSPEQALGRRAAKHPHEWQRGELPERFVDVFNSDLRDSGAPLRDLKRVKRAFGSSRYRKQKARRAALIAEGRAVPRHFMKASYQDFDHIHPGTLGHRLLATLACQKAPRSWGCDCAKIARATWKKGRVRGQ